MEADLNLPRPIVAGGTGATTADDALNNLSGEKARQTVDNYDTFTFVAGSFGSDSIPGRNAPVNAHGFTGICYTYAPNPTDFQILEARDLQDTVVPGRKYIRQRLAGVWGPWTQDNTVIAGNPVITGVGPVLTLNRTVAANATDIYHNYNGVVRWIIRVGGGPETGGNTGSDFSIIRMNDAGATIDSPISISRSTGVISFPTNITSTSPTTGSLVLTGTGGMGIGGMLSLNNATFQNAGTLWGKNTGGTSLNMMSAGGDNHLYVGGTGWLSATFQGKVRILDTTASTSQASGCLTLGGGLGVAGAIFTGTTTSPVSPGVIRVGFDAVTANAIAFRGSTNAAYPVVFENSSGTQVGNITNTGTTTAYNTSSDGALKEDLQPAGIDASQILNNTDIFNFRWKGTSERAYGVIAQQAAPIYPGPFIHNDTTDRWFVDYSKYVPILIQEAKTLRTRVKDLEARLNAGNAAALDVAIAVRNAMTAIPDTFTAINFASMKIQLDALTEAIVAMLEAQAPP